MAFAVPFVDLVPERTSVASASGLTIVRLFSFAASRDAAVVAEAFFASFAFEASVCEGSRLAFCGDACASVTTVAAMTTVTRAIKLRPIAS